MGGNNSKWEPPVVVEDKPKRIDFRRLFPGKKHATVRVGDKETKREKAAKVATQTVVAAGLAYLIYKGYERFQLKKNDDDSPGPDAPSSSAQTGVTPTGTTTTRTVTVIPADPNAPGLKAVGGL